MVSEQEKTLQALQVAIQMEIDGREYYLSASQQSRHELGQKLLQTLAAEEDLHRQKFQEIYQAIRERKAWPVTDFKPNKGKTLRTVFARATRKMDDKPVALPTEIEAIQIAINMETKSYDFYKSQAGKAGYDAERNFFNIVAAEEHQHHLILLNYQEYLSHPADWFVKKERTSYDGG